MIDAEESKAVGNSAAAAALAQVRAHARALADQAERRFGEAGDEDTFARDEAECVRYAASAHALGNLFTQVVLAMVSDVGPDFAHKMLETIKAVMSEVDAQRARATREAHH